MNTTALSLGPIAIVKSHSHGCLDKSTVTKTNKCDEMCLVGNTLQFDYTNQAYIVNGKYADCSHPVVGTITIFGDLFEGCDCYGRAHAGEVA